jgi:hypothetical protein
MKNDKSKSLTAKLRSISDELGIIHNSESRSALLKSLEDLISSLTRLREELGNPSLHTKTEEVRAPLQRVIEFLERAKSDEVLQTLLSAAGIAITAKPKRQMVVIPENLSNDEIRALLQRDLSKAELKAIAVQRAISVGELSLPDIKRAILKNLERQEGYGRLASS